MNKIVINDTFDYGVDDTLVRIVDDPDVMSRKVASSVRESWGDMKPEKGRILVHAIALGAFEKTGDNSNHDAFEEKVCEASHPDFVKKARLYRHHKKTAEEKKDGDVIRSAYNKNQGRVELVISAIEDKCADWLGDLEKGGKVNFSMGWSCSDGDICSICNNRAHRRSEYCDHIKKNASAPYGLGKILPDGRKCFTYNRDGHWNDISYVNRGADMIAMDLAKIASASSEEVGGAELYELLGYCEDEKVSKKVALARRLHDLLSGPIKMGALSPMCNSNTISEKSATDILSNSPKEVFSFFSKKGYVMPFSLFVDSVCPSLSPELESHINNAKVNFSDYASEIYSNRGNLEALAKTGAFDAIPNLPVYLDNETVEELDKIANTIDNDRAMFVMVENALNKEAGEKDTTPKTKIAKSLVESYIAYKIAAIASKDTNNVSLFDLFLIN
jgi:hypothetical protein